MANLYPVKERRKFKRAKESSIINLRVLSVPENDKQFITSAFDGVMADISEGGMGFIAGESFAFQSTLEAKFTLFNDHPLRGERSRTIECRCETRYITKVEERSYRSGIYFMDLSGEDRSFIANLVKFA